MKRLVLCRCFEIDDDGSLVQRSELRHTSNLEELEVLQLETPGFDDECLEYFQNVSSLREFTLTWANITSAGLSHLKNMKQLEKLDFRRSIARGRSSSSPFHELFASWKSLRELNLRSCDLQDGNLAGIDALQETLTVLNLGYHEGITDEGMRHLCSLEKLEILCTFGCAITDEGIRILFAENPDSFPSLHELRCWGCDHLTETTFTHLAQNNNLRHNLRSLDCSIAPSLKCISSSIARLSRLEAFSAQLGDDVTKKCFLIQSLKN